MSRLAPRIVSLRVGRALRQALSEMGASGSGNQPYVSDYCQGCGIPVDVDTDGSGRLVEWELLVRGGRPGVTRMRVHRCRAGGHEAAVWGPGRNGGGA